MKQDTFDDPAQPPALIVWDTADAKLNKALVTAFSRGDFCVKEKELSDDRLRTFCVDLLLELISEVNDLISEFVEDDDGERADISKEMSDDTPT